MSEYFYCYRKDLRKPCSDGRYIWTGSLPPFYHQRWLEGQCRSLLIGLSSSLLSLQSYNKQHKRSQRNASVQSYQHNIWTEEIPAIIVSAHGLTEISLSLSLCWTYTALSLCDSEKGNLDCWWNVPLSRNSNLCWANVAASWC